MSNGHSKSTNEPGSAHAINGDKNVSPIFEEWFHGNLSRKEVTINFLHSFARLLVPASKKIIGNPLNIAYLLIEKLCVLYGHVQTCYSV